MAEPKKKISIVTPCYNEEANVEVLFERVKALFAAQDKYEFEHIFIDNASKDKTVEVLRGMAAKDQHVKVIVNSRNFGHIRSPHHALMNARGDAAIILVADLQDPPELINDFLRKWEEGFKIVCGVKTSSEESFLFFTIRRIYYWLAKRIADIELLTNFYGFGLYDQCVIEAMRQMDDPYPYFRGMIVEVGFERAIVNYRQAKRVRGFTKNNLYTLYDMAMLGFTSHSKLPLRLAIFTGFTLAFFSLMTALGYLVYKLMYWNEFAVGAAPQVIGMFFFSSVQLIFIGILGEYIGFIHTKVTNRPLVVEKERINF